MLVITFILLSILFTILSFIFCRRILSLVKSIENQPYLDRWFLLTTIVIFSLISLLTYLFLIITAYSYNITRHVLVSSLILGLSIFIFVILNFSFKLIKELNEANTSLKERGKQLEKTEVLLEEKNKELNKTLEDFYTYRLKMADELTPDEKRIIKKENKQLAKKLNNK